MKTKYVVFLDNDVLFTPRWLEELVGCAEETGAWVVGPLYLEGELTAGLIHMAGGSAHFGEENGESVFYDEHRWAGLNIADVRSEMDRKPCDYVEFHCTLIRADALQRLGPFDEGLLSLHEHIDLGLRVRDAGGSAYFEPRSVVSYVPPPPYDSHDFPFFMMRWSDAWNQATVQRFKEKWGYATMRYFGDAAPPGSEDTILRWARGHRRRMTGLRLSEEGEGSPKTPLEEAQYMIALFLSIDRDSFDLRLADRENIVEKASRLNPRDVFDRLSEMWTRADADGLSLSFRPTPVPGTHPVAILRLDGVAADRLARLRPHCFLVLRTGPETHQCWIAVAKGDPRSSALWRRLGLTPRAAGAEPVPIAGRSPAAGVPAVRLAEGNAGLLVPLSSLEADGLLPLLRSGVVA